MEFLSIFSDHGSRQIDTSIAQSERASPPDNDFLALPESTTPSTRPAIASSALSSLGHRADDNTESLEANSSEDHIKTSAEDSVKTGGDTEKKSCGAAMPSTLHKLPLELRQLCYKFAMKANEDFDWESGLCFVGYEEMKYLGYVPTICRTSKTVLEEAYPVYISDATFRVSHPSTVKVLETFLASLPGDTGFKAVSSLEFNHFDRPHYTTNRSKIQLTHRCPGLQRLRLGFDVTSLVRREHAGFGRTAGRQIPKAV